MSLGHVPAVVVGAGVVGLATGRLLSSSMDVLIVEQASQIGTGTSSRNSEVVHAGIYYPHGSLKADLCVEGKRLLYEFCENKLVPVSQCGKYIVATSESEEIELHKIQRKAQQNGVTLRMVTADFVKEAEPNVVCRAALFSESTGIVDSHALMLALQGEAEDNGAMFAFNTHVQGCAASAGPIELLLHSDGACHSMTCDVLVNAAGHGAVPLAHALGGVASNLIPLRYFAKGNYYSMPGSPFRHLIYPVPDPSGAGLGVHATVDLAGAVRFGPDVQWVESPDDLAVDASGADAFYAQIRTYFPALPDGVLSPDYAGMRPKISAPGSPAADFCILGPRTHGRSGLVHLFGIESPGLTSSLAIGARVCHELGLQMDRS